MAKRKSKSRSRSKKDLGLSRGIYWKASLLGFFLLFLFFIYRVYLFSNIAFKGQKHYFFVQNTTSIHSLADTLEARGIIKSSISLRVIADLKNMHTIEKGLLEFDRSWNNYQLVKHWIQDEPISYTKTTLRAYRLRSKYVEQACATLPNVEKSEVWKLLRDSEFLDSLGYNNENVFCVFMPGTYYLPKNINARQFLEAMHNNYLFFWNKKRLAKAADLDLSPVEVSILSSIVISETKLKSEMGTIAGVYLNRLFNNMKLQSDPTVLYATQKYGARRVYINKRQLPSDYNTYQVKGLPPGPIYCTPTYVIDEVLNHNGHSYYYFCAKDDFSGCHLFAETYDEHKINAQKFRNALNRAGIR
jgi:UPF0755 protein